ncbi:lipoprotein 17-related variable surface protein [[Mycoplasma] mobile]|uniref:Variable surface protein mvspC n=1 Tax=Mycoplasma mobile (strain ATCC 43663 / 163K / NCTC 11711) TaxID=267748 RepID=Q6KHW7_MYCM1|nr:lipoprotein 17-related variable surface protein [[Mycoplasma] mobile]AAT27809.1 variable surface protein mvspC [Mycoplasma mobile 163K]
MNKKNMILGSIAVPLATATVIGPVVATISPNANIDSITLRKEFETIDRLDIKELATTSLPSVVTNANINDYIISPSPRNGINFSLRLPNPNEFNDENGTISVFLIGTRNNESRSKKILVTNFRATDEILGINAIIDNELKLITNIETTAIAKTTLPSEVTQENIDSYLITPRTSNGVVFQLELNNPSTFNDSTGILEFSLKASMSQIVRTKNVSVILQTSTQRVEQVLQTINNTSFTIENISNRLASSIVNSDIILNPTTLEKVNLSFSIKNANDTQGILSLEVIGSLSNSTISKQISILGFPTKEKAFADAIGLLNGTVNTNFFTPSRTNLNPTNFTDFQTKLAQIGFISKHDFGIATSRVSVTNYQISTINNAPFNETTRDVRIVVRGTLDNENFSFTRDLTGYTPINDDVLNKLFTINEFAVGSLGPNLSQRNNNVNDLAKFLLENRTNIALFYGSAWDTDRNGAVILVNGIPAISPEFRLRGLRYHIPFVRWEIADSVTSNGRIVSQRLIIRFRFDETIGANDFLSGFNFEISKTIRSV